MTISQLAGAARVSPDTVRFYEREGLLPSPPRSGSGYRIYRESDLERLRFIRGAQRVGLRLREIRELLVIWDRGRCPCGHTRTLALRRLEELDEEIAALQETRRALEGLAEAMPAEDLERTQEPWPCELSFMDGERG